MLTDLACDRKQSTRVASIHFRLVRAAASGSARDIELAHRDDDIAGERVTSDVEPTTNVQSLPETCPIEGGAAEECVAVDSGHVSATIEDTGCQFDEHVAEIPEGQRRRVEVPACPVCDGVQAVPVFVVAGIPYRVVACAGCGLGRLDPLPNREAIASFYPREYYGSAGAKFKPLVEAFIRIVAARQVRSLVRHLPRGARVLDIGCGRGVLLSALIDRGFEAHGFEISRTAVAAADPRAEICVADELREARYPAAYFDEVVLWHVLEHVSDPRETLRETHRILKRGGRLAVSVPNFSSLQARWAGAAWFHLDLPRHLFHFPLAALRRLITDSGFDCCSEHHFSLRQNPFGWVQSFLNQRPGLPRNGLYRMLKQTDEPGRFTRFEVAIMLSVYYLGMPPAIAASMVAALLRRGASVCVKAQKRE